LFRSWHNSTKAKYKRASTQTRTQTPCIPYINTNTLYTVHKHKHKKQNRKHNTDTRRWQAHAVVPNQSINPCVFNQNTDGSNYLFTEAEMSIVLSWTYKQTDCRQRTPEGGVGESDSMKKCVGRWHCVRTDRQYFL